MSYLVLARKYRPRTFAEVVGQETATATLRGAIDEERIGHAYLFCGPRGTGKTTVARIFAKALNCEKGPTADPCGTCERCRCADDGSEADIVEIDAASNRGIDDIRGLREAAGYRPMRARFKIFLVDEAHMLTKEAVNAFLKTLEEPPPHVKLFFATTEPERLLSTFVSRCQTVRLELLSQGAIAARLVEVFRLEGVRAGQGVPQEIARRSRGGLRDALSLADQLISLVGVEPSLQDLEKLADGAGREEVEALLDRVEAGDRVGVLSALPAAEGTERELLAGLLSCLRTTLLAGLSGEDRPLPDIDGGVDAGARKRLRARFERLGCDRIEIWLAELLRARERVELLRGASARLIVETTLLDLCRAETSLPLGEIEKRLLALEARLEGRPEPRSATSAPGTSAPPPPERPPSNPAPPARSIEWDRLLALLDSEARSIAEILRARGRLERLQKERAEIRLTGLREGERAILGEPRNAKIVSSALTRILGEPCEVSLLLGDPTSVRRPSSDLFTQKVADSFGGKIVEEA